MGRKTNITNLSLRFILITLSVVGVFALLFFATTGIDKYMSMTFNVLPRLAFNLSTGFLIGLFFSKDVIIKHIRHRNAKKMIDWNHLFVFIDLLLIVILFLTTWDVRRLFLLIDPTFDFFLFLPMLLGYFLPRIWKEDSARIKKIAPTI